MYYSGDTVIGGRDFYKTNPLEGKAAIPGIFLAGKKLPSG